MCQTCVLHISATYVIHVYFYTCDTHENTIHVLQVQHNQPCVMTNLMWFGVFWKNTRYLFNFRYELLWCKLVCEHHAMPMVDHPILNQNSSWNHKQMLCWQTFHKCVKEIKNGQKSYYICSSLYVNKIKILEVIWLQNVKKTGRPIWWLGT